MVDIAYCESRNRQFLKDGSVITGKAGEKGLYQIHPVHFPTLEKKGIDPLTLGGNIEAAKHVLAVQGITAWSCFKMI